MGDLWHQEYWIEFPSLIWRGVIHSEGWLWQREKRERGNSFFTPCVLWAVYKQTVDGETEHNKKKMKMASARTPESFVWSDNEVELLLRHAFDYKVSKKQETQACSPPSLLLLCRRHIGGRQSAVNIFLFYFVDSSSCCVLPLPVFVFFLPFFCVHLFTFVH